MESKRLQETLPVFHVSPRTLQDMAASECALDCWRNVIRMQNYDWDDICDDEWSIDDAPFPVGVRSLINKKIQLIEKELKKWRCDHSFVRLSPEAMVNCVVLNQAGDICYKRTAKNFLTANPSLMLEEQFEIACNYCCEEDVQRLWLLLGKYHYYYTCDFRVTPEYFGPIDYWRAKMRREFLQAFLKKGNEERDRSLEWIVLSNRRNTRTGINNWAQVEYFWHKLNREEQSSVVGNILLDQKFTKHLILKLDDEMLENLPSSQLKFVFIILAEDELCYELALQVWSYMNVKNIIVENTFSFYKTLACLSKVAFQDTNSFGFHISRLLKDMWLSASVDFKNYVLSHQVEDLFAQSLGCVDIKSFGSDVGFFIELLSGVSFEIRRRIWQRWWRKFFLLAQVSNILELMTLCFVNADDIVQFKKDSMLDYKELRGIFKEFIEGGFFDELTEYLKFCCSDEEDEKRVREARKKLALQNFDRITECDPEPVFCKFLQFFNDSVSSADLAEVLKWEFKDDKEANLLSMCILYDDGGLDIFNEALRYFQFPDQRVIELKRFFYERCQYVLMSGDFLSFFIQDWEGFLLWCTSSTENLNRLRDSIAIDDLFENFLINMHKFFMDCRDTSVVKYRYSDVCVLNSIDRLLRWYFKDRENATAKQFKRDKIIGYENSEAIKMLLNMENFKILRYVLFWFFDYKTCELKSFLEHFDNVNYIQTGLQNVIISLGK